MFNIINLQDLDIFQAYLDEFGQTIGELIVQKERSPITAQAATKESGIFKLWVNVMDDPFATNTSFKEPPIVINEAACDALELTDREKYAFISHEIGHIIDDRTIGNNQADREFNADGFAVELNLRQELISGLHKLVNNSLYNDQSQGITLRIQKLMISDN